MRNRQMLPSQGKAARPTLKNKKGAKKNFAPTQRMKNF
jgi:hypothetical protein